MRLSRVLPCFLLTHLVDLQWTLEKQTQQGPRKEGERDKGREERENDPDVMCYLHVHVLMSQKQKILKLGLLFLLFILFLLFMVLLTEKSVVEFCF